jgi:hypothetical protein
MANELSSNNPNPEILLRKVGLKNLIMGAINKQIRREEFIFKNLRQRQSDVYSEQFWNTVNEDNSRIGKYLTALRASLEGDTLLLTFQLSDRFTLYLKAYLDRLDKQLDIWGGKNIIYRKLLREEIKYIREIEEDAIRAHEKSIDYLTIP